MKKATLFILVLCLSITSLVAQEETDSTASQELSDEEMAKKLANPNAAVGTMNTFIDVSIYQGDLPGANDQSTIAVTFQPSFPKPNFVGSQMLFLRPAIPILFNPKSFSSTENDFENAGVNLGDIGYDLAMGGTSKKGLIYLYGINGTIPTATDPRIRGQWTLGPELVLGLVSEKIVFGGLVSQRWDLESGDQKTSVLGGQYFYAIPLKNGNVIGAGPSWNYNWVSKELTFPIGTGWTKTTKLGKMPFKYGVQVMYFVAQPDSFGQEWQIRIQLSPVVKLPWE